MSEITIKALSPELENMDLGNCLNRSLLFIIPDCDNDLDDRGESERKRGYRNLVNDNAYIRYISRDHLFGYKS